MKLGFGKKKRKQVGAEGAPQTDETVKKKSPVKTKAPGKPGVPANAKAPAKPGVPAKPVSSKTLVKRGFAGEGDLVATLEPAVFGKDGKNVFGESVPTRKVEVPRLLPGSNIGVEKGTHFIMRTAGVVEVTKDSKGTLYIQGKMYRRGKCSVVVSEDRMSVVLSIISSVGDAPQVSVQDILAELNEQGVTLGIDRQAIEAAVEQVEETGNSVEDQTIARGETPVHGTDGSLELHVMRASGSSVKVKGDGRANFKDLDRVTSVQAGQLVALMKKETPGQKEGHTVTGETVEAKTGRPVDIEFGDNIRIEDRGDVVEYYSEINGQLVMNGKVMSVEPVLVIEGDVGPKTGNIRFSGTVHVTGSVQDTFNVFAKKDIVVDGNVGNAIIRTDGNLQVGGGVVGKGKGLVSVGGEVKVKFAENANIQAGQNIEIQRAALNCTMTSGARVISIQEKGQIIGGEIRAREGVEVKILGNDSEHRMVVQVGSDFSLQTRLEEIQTKVQKYDRALKKILLVLGKLKKVNPDPSGLPENLKKLYEDARKKGTVAKIAIHELKGKEAELSAKLEEMNEAEIIVRDTLYRGVKIHFGKTIYEPETSESNIKITYNEKKGGVELNRLA
jgi:uncharacterized protein (DUF342 family)